MTTMIVQARTKPTFSRVAEQWEAVVRRDAAADGQFVYAVRTTGVYCRPSCGARRAKRENVEFYVTTEEAERAGFRACMRCGPKDGHRGKKSAEAVAKACRMIMADEGADVGPLAGAVGMSVSQFRRAFKAHTGLTPKGYAKARRSQRVREELGKGASVTSAVYRAGFNSSGRFYATAGKALGMKPAAFRAGGAGERIRFAVGECSLGSILVAASDRGICAIALGDDPEKLVRDLEDRFGKAELVGGDREFEKVVAKVVAFVESPRIGLHLPLDVRGTAFQQRVWQKLCEIPCGKTRSYAEIAEELGDPKATRAVAGACAANGIAVAIPCHRVVRMDGSLSGYRWGIERKAKLLEIEGE